MNPKLKGLFALIFSAFLGGAVIPVLVRTGLHYADPFIFSLLRSFGTLLLFLPVLLRNKHSVGEKDFQKLTVLAGIGAGANLTLFSLGITHTTVVASQLVYALLPITVPIVGFLLIREKMSLPKTVGAVIGLVGVLLLIFFSRSEAERLALGTLYGNGLIFSAMIFYTFYLVISKQYTKSFSPVLISTITYLGLSLFFLPFAIFQGILGNGTVNWSPTFLFILLGITLVSFGFTYTLQYGLNKVSSTTVAITSLLAPEFAALAGAQLFNEKISPLLIMSMVLVSLGVSVSVSGEKGNVWQKMRMHSQKFIKNTLRVI